MDEMTMLVLSVILSALAGQILGYFAIVTANRYRRTERCQERILIRNVRGYMREARSQMKGDVKFFQQFNTNYTDINMIFEEHEGERIDDVSLESGSNIDNLEKALLSKLEDDQGHSFCIVGDYGMGKSTLLIYLFHKLCEMKKLVILAPLSYADRPPENGTALMSAAVNYLNDKYKIEITNLNLFERKISKGEIILLFDGFDEYVDNLNRFPEEMFNDLININDEEKIIIATRRSTFQSLRHFFKDARKRYNDIGGENKMEIIKLKTLSEKEIKKILKKRNISKEIEDKLLSKHLLDLCGQHLLLEMAIEVASCLDGNYRRADIYEKYISEPLEGRPDRLFTLSVLEKIAHRMFIKKKHAITSEELESITDEKPKLDDLPFILYQDGVYRFTHASFLEFFVARGLLNAIEYDTVSEITNLRKIAYHYEVNRFINEMIPKKLAPNLKEMFTTENSRCVKYLGLHSYTNIYRLDDDKETARNFISKCMESEKDPFIMREMFISLALLGDIHALHNYIKKLEMDDGLDSEDYRFELSYFDGNKVALVEEGVRRLSDLDYNMRELMIRALGRHGDISCIPTLMPFKKDPVDFIREAADKAIKKISLKQ